MSGGSDAPSETFEPEGGSAASVEDVEALDVAEQVQLAVAECDEVRLVLLAFVRCQGILF